MTTRKPSVLVSILSWDSPRYLANLFDNLDGFPPSLDAGLRTHFHVLDQGSADDTRELVRAFARPGSNRSAEFLRRNVGFGRGHNRVFDTVYRKGRFDFFVVLNQDVVFGRPGWLDRLVEGMADETVAIGGPVAWEVSNAPGAMLETCMRPDLHPERIFSIQGSVAIIRTTAVERFGLFDEAFAPAYFEDTDLCRRYAAAGYRMAWIGVEQAHGYLGAKEKLIRRKGDALQAEFGDFHKRNRALFRSRWMTGESPIVTPEAVPELWPRVYRPIPK